MIERVLELTNKGTSRVTMATACSSSDSKLLRLRLAKTRVSTAACNVDEMVVSRVRTDGGPRSGLIVHHLSGR